MSLVAYEASSDEESDREDLRNESPKAIQANGGNSKYTNGNDIQISDEETDDFMKSSEKNSNFDLPTFSRLPEPKASNSKLNQMDIEEQDDEFLHKKEEAPKDLKPPPVATRNPVRITIPSLSQFKDVEEDDKKSKSKKIGTVGPSLKPSGLLNMLPQPKHGALFGNKNEFADLDGSTNLKKNPSLIPDSVKNRTKSQQPSTSSSKETTKKSGNLKRSLNLTAGNNDSDDDDDNGDGEDFFSLNSKMDLPEVSTKEINAMIAKTAAKMAQVSSKFSEFTKLSNENRENGPDNETVEENMDSEEIQVDEKAIQVLVGGSRAKRQKVENVNIVELSSAEVLPSKDEWLRSALATSTTYQPRGLVDEEPAPGTRRKHQITYLAHKAKSNESELQAMWAANRHTRRQTQSKYGF